MLSGASECPFQKALTLTFYSLAFADRYLSSVAILWPAFGSFSRSSSSTAVLVGLHLGHMLPLHSVRVAGLLHSCPGRRKGCDNIRRNQNVPCCSTSCRSAQEGCQPKHIPSSTFQVERFLRPGFVACATLPANKVMNSFSQSQHTDVV